MRTALRTAILVVLVAVALIASWSSSRRALPRGAKVDPELQARAAAQLMNAPLVFEPNREQADAPGRLPVARARLRPAAESPGRVADRRRRQTRSPEHGSSDSPGRRDKRAPCSPNARTWRRAAATSKVRTSAAGCRDCRPTTASATRPSTLASTWCSTATSSASNTTSTWRPARTPARFASRSRAPTASS